MIVFFIIGTVVALLFYVINLSIYVLPNLIKSSAGGGSQSDLVTTYECGFETISNQSRTEHSISYYLIALLYVIFDLEIALILPALISLSLLGAAGSVLLIAIMTLLCFAFVYELGLGTFNHVNRLQ